MYGPISIFMFMIVYNKNKDTNNFWLQTEIEMKDFSNEWHWLKMIFCLRKFN